MANASKNRDVTITRRFEDALVFATRLHGKQKRKSSSVPYLAHLLGVAALVLEDGGDEEEAIAALLHDAVEDQGGWHILEVISTRFGERVAKIVEGCSDSFSEPKPPWRERKERYLMHIPQASPEVRRVSLADKLYNAFSILRSYKQSGEETWKRFNGGREGTLWYYRSLVSAFKTSGDDYMTSELERVVAELEQLAG